MDINKDKKIEILEEYMNSVGHALLDYHFAMGIDRTSQIQSRHRAMEKIQIADDKARLMLEALSQLTVNKELIPVVSHGVVEIKVDMRLLEEIMQEPYTKIVNGVLYFRNNKE